jgi:DNA-binding FadR family transcriptional regulator
MARDPLRVDAVVQLRRNRLSDDVVRYLTREIVGGALKPGEALPSEAELADRYGVSRPVARESIQALAAMGLVGVQQGKRTLVQEATAWNVLAAPVQTAFHEEGRGAELAEQFYEVRRILEASAAALAAKHAKAEHRKLLTEMAREMKAIAGESRGRRRFLAIDHDFHATMARISGNVVLSQVIRNIHAFLSAAWSNSNLTADGMAVVADQHIEIADAIAAGDAERAGSATEAHIEFAQNDELRPNARDDPPE